jgi:hypothetical protein
MNFRGNKKRIEAKKRKKRQEKMNRRLNKPAEPALGQNVPEIGLPGPEGQVL